MLPSLVAILGLFWLTLSKSLRVQSMYPRIEYLDPGTFRECIGVQVRATYGASMLEVTRQRYNLGSMEDWVLWFIA